MSTLDYESVSTRFSIASVAKFLSSRAYQIAIWAVVLDFFVLATLSAVTPLPTTSHDAAELFVAVVADIFAIPITIFFVHINRSTTILQWVSLPVNAMIWGFGTWLLCRIVAASLHHYDNALKTNAVRVSGFGVFSSFISLLTSPVIPLVVIFNKYAHTSVDLLAPYLAATAAVCIGCPTIALIRIGSSKRLRGSSLPLATLLLAIVAWGIIALLCYGAHAVAGM